MNRCLIGHGLKLKFCLFVTAGLFVSCQTNDESALKNDRSALQTISQVNASIQNEQRLSPDLFERMKQVYERYPTAPSAHDAYRSALMIRKDWAALVEFFQRQPESTLKLDDKLTLAKALLKLGRYEDAVESIAPLVVQDNFEAKCLLANAYFHLGRYDEAKTLLDKNWQEILNEKKIDEITMRGMIYFYQHEFDKAIETMNRSIEIDPDHYPALNGISRVYAAKGDRTKAGEILKRVQQIVDKKTAEAKRGTKLVELSQKLKEAYDAKRFQEVIDIANEMLREADAKDKVTLYQFQYESYVALGKQKEAQVVLNKANSQQ